MPMYVNKGQMIEIDLSGYGYKGYYVEAIYRYDESVEATQVTMYAIKKDKDGSLSAISPVQNSQYITSTKGSAKSDIVRIVKYMCANDMIKKYLPYEAETDTEDAREERNN